METSTFPAFTEKKLFPFLVIFGVSFLTYFQVYTFDFCYDDFYSVLPIQDVEKLSSILRYFTEPVLFLELESGKMQPLSYYRPVATSTLTIDFFLFGKENPGWLHIENLLIHTLNCSIFFLICRELLGKTFVAVCAACLYVVFPLSTEIVSIYHYRVDLVTSFFIFLTLFVTLKNTEKYWTWQVAALFLCAMLCKESAISLLLLIPLFRHFRHELPKPQELFIVLGIPMLIYWPLRYNALGSFLHPKTNYVIDDFFLSVSTGERLLYVLESFWQKCFYILSPYSISPKVLVIADSSHVLAILGFALLLTLTVAGLLYLKRKNLVFLLSGAILISWFPVSSILIPIPDFVSPRLFYYPSPWIVLLLVVLLLRIPQNYVKVTLITMLLLTWTSASYVQKTWNKNNLTKSLGILSFNPYALDATMVAAEEFFRVKNYSQAIVYYNNALVIMQAGEKGLKHRKARPALKKLAETYLRLNNTKKALFVLKMAKLNYPKEGVFYYLTAVVHLTDGNEEKAEQSINEGLLNATDFQQLHETFEKVKVRKKQEN